MKHYTFFREDNSFADILSDPILKKNIVEVIKWNKHLMIGLSQGYHPNDISYLALKFGDALISNLTKDFSPIPGVDYTPEKDISKYSKVVK